MGKRSGPSPCVSFPVVHLARTARSEAAAGKRLVLTSDARLDADELGRRVGLSRFPR
jgi:hypothetical protein